MRNKKNMFIARLMVLMMIVSLLSGMNLSVAKAAAVVDPSKRISFTIVKEWDTVPEEGAEAKFQIIATQGTTEVEKSVVELSDTQETRSYYDFTVSSDKKTWKAKLSFDKTYQNKPVTITVQEMASKIYTVSPSTPQTATDGAELKFTN